MMQDKDKIAEYDRIAAENSELKSEKNGNIGMNIVIDKRIDFDISSLCDIENVAYAVEE